jgi:cytochrome c-type biogenesis protein CcmH/NrfG
VRLLRVAFALGVAGFGWAFVGGLVYLVELHGGLSLRTDPLSEARRRALRGDVAGAARQYRVATTIEPTDVGGLCELGELLARAGRYDEALEAFASALRVRLDARALAGIGDVWLVRGDFARAAHAYEQSLRLRPGQPQAQERLARARAALERR